MTENPTLSRLTMALTEKGAAAAIRIIFQLSTDDELVAAYQATDGCEGNAVADLLVVEMERRGVTVEAKPPEDLSAVRGISLVRYCLRQ